MKAQTATEYLIILALVIVISLIVIGVLGGVPSIGGGALKNTKNSELKTNKIAVDSFFVNQSYAKLKLKNNEASTLTINKISVDTIPCEPPELPLTLKMGQTTTIECYGRFTDHSSGRTVPKIGFQYRNTDNAAIYETDYSVISSGLHTGDQVCYSGILGDTPTSKCNSAHIGQDAYEDGTKRTVTMLEEDVFIDDQTHLFWTKNLSSGNQNQAVSFCDALEKAGYNDWRLPNIIELLTLTDRNASTSIIDGLFWTTTINAPAPTRHYTVTRTIHSFSAPLSSDEKDIVCVRGYPYGITLTDGFTVRKNFTDNGDGTITDQHTGLMWEDATIELTSTSWMETLQYCDDQTTGGYSDWRTPTVIETITLVDFYCAGNNNPDSSCSGEYTNSVLNSVSFNAITTGTSSKTSYKSHGILNIGYIFYAGALTGLKDADTFTALCVRNT